MQPGSSTWGNWEPISEYQGRRLEPGTTRLQTSALTTWPHHLPTSCLLFVIKEDPLKHGIPCYKKFTGWYLAGVSKWTNFHFHQTPLLKSSYLTGILFHHSVKTAGVQHIHEPRVKAFHESYWFESVHVCSRRLLPENTSIFEHLWHTTWCLYHHLIKVTIKLPWLPRK